MSGDPRESDLWEDGECCGWGKFFLIVILLALSGLWYWMGG